MPLRRRDPGMEAAQRTIRHAFEDLSKSISPADAKDFSDATLESVQNAVLEVENQLGMRSSLRNMRRLMPLFSGLEHYSKAIEILCNGTPYLPWIWAPIKLIIMIASEFTEAIEQIIRSYARIGKTLTRFRVLQVTFSANASFQQTLAGFYAGILKFHKQAYKLVRRSCWKILFMTSWGRFQARFNNIIEDLKGHEELVEKEASAHHMAQASDMKQSLDLLKYEMHEKLDSLAQDEKKECFDQRQAISAWLKLDQDDQLAIFDKLESEGRKFDGTCSWILKNTKMASWLQSKPETPIVWLQGIPGAGKSIIIGRLIKYLSLQTEASLVVSHFCTHSYASSTEYLRILRSLLFQTLYASDDLVAYIYKEFVASKKTATISALEKLLTTVVLAVLGEPGQRQAIHIFLDGLDEVEAEKQRQVVNLLSRVSRQTQSRGAVVKVLFSCRPSPLLDRILEKLPRVSLSDEKAQLEEAITVYANQRLQTRSDVLSQLRIYDRDILDLSSRIAKKADGMFLWARLVLDYLASNILHSREEVVVAIETLPRELSKFYEQILMNIIAKFDKRSVERLRRILGWVAFAKRPLRRREFQSALAFGEGNPQVDEPIPPYIFDMGAPLIEQLRDSTFSFIHVSVKDYLETPDSKIKLSEDNEMREHGLASITCLLSGIDVFRLEHQSTDRSLRVVKGLHDFHVYANEFWVDYIFSIATSNSGLVPSSLSNVLGSLSDRLDLVLEHYNMGVTDDGECSISDKRLELLKGYKGIQKSARQTLLARTKRAIDIDSDERTDRISDLRPLKGLGDILANYQASVRSLLSAQEVPGVTSDELESFKQDSRSSAYTCRFPMCPRTTLGFYSKDLQLEHEATHTQRLLCLHSGCQYPVFPSSRALKNHENSCHGTVQGRRTIRRVSGSIGQQPRPAAGTFIARTGTTDAMSTETAPRMQAIEELPWAFGFPDTIDLTDEAFEFHDTIGLTDEEWKVKGLPMIPESMGITATLGFPTLGSMDIDTTNAPPLNEIDAFPIEEVFNSFSEWGEEPTISVTNPSTLRRSDLTGSVLVPNYPVNSPFPGIYSGSSSPAPTIQASDTEEVHSSRPPKSAKDIVRTARDHFLYKNAYPHDDGLFHCPWKDDSDSTCNHKPDRSKYVYSRYVDWHLKPYRCEFEGCQNKSYSSPSVLRKHQSKAHGVALNTRQSKSKARNAILTMERADEGGTIAGMATLYVPSQ